ncbi:copper chaperone PCu(A)C [Rhizobium sp. FKL33]|uniref:copper chaperone PCu(A)C n=1 Tax=Rhizobium sp. FKL33 TaxID=2562307 RepID=UPI0010BFA362|nr:copper chaperone PCu(A)C [Rhizobium sp. FKL33]
MHDTGTDTKPMRLAAATLVFTLIASAVTASTQDVHSQSSEYEGSVLVEHAEFVPFGSDGFAGYLTIWNGSSSDKVIRSIEVEAFGKAELAKRVSDDVVRSMLDASVVTVPSKSELHMDIDTVFLLLNGTKAIESPKITVRFDDGSSASLQARFIADDTSLTDHHHPSPNKP